MWITFGLYALARGGTARFVPFLGRDDADALVHAQDMLAQDAAIDQIDVHRGGELIFSVTRPDG
ncbi:MAG: hypothetical protein JNJ73_17520 [Hyphomonadaceae bacterium]|nr:hypothetical protein [Hyphomonadaceae bacterium]